VEKIKVADPATLVLLKIIWNIEWEEI